MQQFLETSWLSILSIVIGVIVAYIFYRLQKKDAASASVERKKHATVELLDVIESYIINKQRLSEHVIDNLIYASERDHSVALRPACTATSLLQDVALRLQRSRHLDIPQKSEYSEKIEQLIREIRENREPIQLYELNIDMAEKLSELEAFIQPELREDAKTIMTAIASLAERKREISLRTEENKYQVTQIAIVTTFFGVTSALATGLIGSRLFERVTDSPVSLLFSKLFPLFGMLLVVLVILMLLVIMLRIRRRNTYSSLHNQTNDS